MQKVHSHVDSDIDLRLIPTKDPELISKKYGTNNVTNFLVIFEDAGIKEIKQIRAFGISSLVGNVGGYIGLFLGFSIIQFPSFCMFLNHKMVSCCRRNKTSASNLNPSESNMTELNVRQKGKLPNMTLDERMEWVEHKIDIILRKVQ